MKKRNTAIVGLIGALLLSTSAGAAPADNFSDFPSDWSAPAMTQAVENGLLTGDNGKIFPTGLLTRAEMAAIVNRAFGATATASLTSFQDVGTGDWYYTDLAKAVKMGTFYGDNGRLYPNDPITREEAFAVLARAFALEEGRAAALNPFSDRSNVSAWAAAGVAALVEQGYVNGSDGKLSPKANITRAEFAQVMSNLAGTYVGSGGASGSVAQGNVIVRESGATLENLTVKGDLILADGAKNVSLDNVTVTGRILIRGGDGTIKASGTSAAQGTVVANPNGATTLSATDSGLGQVTVRSDLVLTAGQLDSMTITEAATVTIQKDAKVASITAAAEGAKVTGAGKVTTVQVTAGNVTVTNPGTTVTAAQGVTGTQAGDKTVAPGGTETIPTTTGGSGGGSSGSGSTGGSGGGSSSSGGSSTTAATIVDAEKTAVITTDAGSWLPLVFEPGFTAENTNVTVDGQDVTSYVTNVLSDGSIAKLPLVATPGTVTLTSGSKTQTIQLGGTAANAVYTGDGYLPDYYLAHGPIAIWDYYLTNYDDAGAARVLPTQTTFATTAAVNEHPSYSPVTVLDEGNTSGNVVIMFNYENTGAKDRDKAWFDNIAAAGALELVSYDQYKTVLNNQLTYTKGTTDHSGTVGTLTIPFGQSNFTTNGRYYIRVCSTAENGANTYALVPIHVVNYDAPTLQVKETPESGRNLHFAVSNMVYGIVDPVEKVTLTKPDGTIEELTYLDDCYLWSQDLFVLYNDNTNHLDQKGKYTITIEAAGFQDFSCTFYVSEGAEPSTTAALLSSGIDALSGSTSSSGSGDSSSDGSYAISANLLFDSDLLANALILEKLDAETAAAATVLDYWKVNTVSDAVFNVGDTSYYAFGDFISAENQAQVNGKNWIPFTEYCATEGVTATFNPPHATKAILEDGLLGDLQDSSVSGKLEAVVPTVSGNEQGKDVVLTFTGDNVKDYLGKINGLLYLNGDWRELGEDKYAIDEEAGTITIYARYLTVGKENSLSIKSAGYKPQDVTFSYNKVNETSLSLSAAPNEETVILTVNSSDGDFLRNLKSVILTKDNVSTPIWKEGVSSADAVYYVVADDMKSLTLYNVKDAGTYTVSIAAEYYEDALTADFTVTQNTNTPDPDPEQKSTPTVKAVEYCKAEMFSPAYYCVTFDGLSQAELKAYLEVVTSVTVGTTEYQKSTSWWNSQNAFRPYVLNDSYGIYDYDCLQLTTDGFSTSGNTAVIIHANGYNDLTFTVTKDGTLDTGSTPEPTPEPTPDPSVSVPTTAPSIEKVTYQSYYKLTFENANAWVSEISSIRINDTDCEKETTVSNLQANKFVLDTEASAIYIQFPYAYDNAIYTVVISTEEKDSLTLEITIPYSIFGDSTPSVSIKGNSL